MDHDTTTSPAPSPADDMPRAPWRQSADLDQLFAALALASADITGADKSRENPAFRSQYATLADCINACRPALTKHGLAVLQPARYTDDGFASVTTILAHKSGQWISSTLDVPVAARDAQKLGSAITYGRRYGLCAMVGVAPEDDDDDGNEAAGKSSSPRASQRGGQQPAAAPSTAPRQTVTSASKDRAGAALKAYMAARKQAGLEAMTSSAAIAHVMGADWKLATDQDAEDFCTAVKFNIEEMTMGGA